MSRIVLTTLNARYIHASFGLRYLLANLRHLQSETALLEFDIHQRPTDIAESILSQSPEIVGVGVYIWNVGPATELVSILKRLRPGLTVVLGGPEVSHEWEHQPVVNLADYLITGEGDLEFFRLCTRLLDGDRPTDKVIHAAPPSFDDLALPYGLYSDEDVAQRILYVEASRGCPFHCEFCLSSLDSGVRQVNVSDLLDHLRALLDRGATHLKFVDRTFNLNLSVCRRILEFCLASHRPGMLFHFEMVPDRLPEGLRELLRQFPPGALQLEVGIQTFNQSVAARISRRQDNSRAEANLKWLRQETGVHLHADLIAGLPGESVESFAEGFNRLVALRPQEIQVGLLKRLRGTPIGRHDRDWGMVYAAHAPYELLQNRDLDFGTVQALKRFARIWDLTANSGNFVEATSLLLDTADTAFEAFWRWSRWLHARTGRTDAIALTRLLELLWRYLTEVARLPCGQVATALLNDYRRSGRTDVPPVIRPHAAHGDRRPPSRVRRRLRQQRHLDPG